MDAEIRRTEDGFTFYTTSRGEEEARFFYREIFHDKAYDVAKLPEDAVIVDAGANIGLFSLYMKQSCPSSRILAFEPAPDSVQMFKRNMRLHNVGGVEIHQCGLGRTSGVGNLTFYQTLPGNSTMHPEQKTDTMATLPSDHPLCDAWTQNVEKITIDVRPLSSVIEQTPALTRIDLLKIDVEGAELDVLAGLDDAHWSMVQNVVLEIDDIHGAMAEVENFLQSKNFSVSKTSPDWALEGFKMYMLVAKRNADE